jgi:hypothetical protein
MTSGSCIVADDRVATRVNDHLVPLEEYPDAAYLRLLSSKLFTTKADYARIVILPGSGGGEMAISLHSLADRAGNVVATCTHAARNLWYARFGEDPDAAPLAQIGIKRSDRAMPLATAIAVSNGIRRMIEKRKPLVKGDTEPLHGFTIVFSVGNDRALTGVLTPVARGSNARNLRNLTLLLEQYCRSSPADASALAAKIERQAKRLAK